MALTLAPTISIQKLTGSTPSGVDEPIASTSKADTGTTMGVTGNGCIYNLAAQSLTESSATCRLTITIPGTLHTTIVDFGLKPYRRSSHERGEYQRARGETPGPSLVH